MNFWRIAGLEQTWAGSWVALDLNTLRITVTGWGEAISRPAARGHKPSAVCPVSASYSLKNRNLSARERPHTVPNHTPAVTLNGTGMAQLKFCETGTDYKAVTVVDFSMR